jgi:uncharacterized membrane protein (UPF0127 family)
MIYECVKQTDNTVIAERVFSARSLLSRMQGLIGRTNLPPEEGLWLIPCRQVHTCFMKFPIHAIFLDENRRVLDCIAAMPPWRMSPFYRCARSVLELSGLTPVPDFVCGDQILFREKRVAQ